MRARRRIQCAEPRCTEAILVDYPTRKEARAEAQRPPWRCLRHARPDSVLSNDNTETSFVLVATKVGNLPGLFWCADGSTTGSGLAYGPGFAAWAKDFAEGTRLVVHATIERKIG